MRLSVCQPVSIQEWAIAADPDEVGDGHYAHQFAGLQVQLLLSSGNIKRTTHSSLPFPLFSKPNPGNMLFLLVSRLGTPLFKSFPGFKHLRLEEIISYTSALLQGSQEELLAQSV